MEKTQEQSKLSQASFLSFLLYSTVVQQTKHMKNFSLFGSGSSKVYFFDFSTSEKSSDYQSHETWKKAFTATSEPGPAISGGCSDGKKKLPDHIKALNTNTCKDYKTGQFLYVALGLPLILFWEEQALGR